LFGRYINTSHSSAVAVRDGGIFNDCYVQKYKTHTILRVVSRKLKSEVSYDHDCTSHVFDVWQTTGYIKASFTHTHVLKHHVHIHTL